MQPPHEPYGGQSALPGYGVPPADAQPPYGTYSDPAPPYGYYTAANQLAPPATQPSSFAIASLVCSLASWILIPFVGAVAAVVLGHVARHEIRHSYGQKSGSGLAMAGLVIGYVQIALFIVALFFFLLLFLAFAFESPTS